MRTFASCGSPSFQEYNTTFRLHPTNNSVDKTGTDCTAFFDSSAPSFCSSSDSDRRVHEYVANEKADLALTSGVGGAKVGNGNRATVASEWARE